MVRILNGTGGAGGGSSSVAPVHGLANPGRTQIPILALHFEDPTVAVNTGRRRGYEWITMTELWNGLQGKQLLPRKPALMTVDDGHLMQYRNMHQQIMALGIRATIFLVSNFLDRLSVYSNLSTYLSASFNATVSQGSSTLTAVSNFTNVVVGTDIGTGTGIPAGTVVGSFNTGAGTIQMVDAAGNPVTATASGTGVAISGAATPMAWAMAKTMYDSGVWDIQHHTQTHTPVTVQTQAQRLAEFSQCSARLVQMIGCPTPICCAYPQGWFNAAAIGDLRTAGIPLGVSGGGGATTANRDTVGAGEMTMLPGLRYAINRSTANNQWFDEQFEEMFYHWENDSPGGINDANKLGYWSNLAASMATGFVYNNSGYEVDTQAASKTLIATDFFRVDPGSRVYYSAALQSLSQTTGEAGVYLEQWSGPGGQNDSKTQLADLPLYTTQTAIPTFAVQRGEVTVGSTTRYVRPKVATNPSWDGSLFKAAEMVIHPAGRIFT